MNGIIILYNSTDYSPLATHHVMPILPTSTTTPLAAAHIALWNKNPDPQSLITLMYTLIKRGDFSVLKELLDLGVPFSDISSTGIDEFDDAMLDLCNYIDGTLLERETDENLVTIFRAVGCIAGDVISFWEVKPNAFEMYAPYATQDVKDFIYRNYYDLNFDEMLRLDLLPSPETALDGIRYHSITENVVSSSIDAAYCIFGGVDMTISDEYEKNYSDYTKSEIVEEYLMYLNKKHKSTGKRAKASN